MYPTGTFWTLPSTTTSRMVEYARKIPVSLPSWSSCLISWLSSYCGIPSLSRRTGRSSMLPLLSPTLGYSILFPSASRTGFPSQSTASPYSTSPVPVTVLVPFFSTSRLAAYILNNAPSWMILSPVSASSFSIRNFVL